MTNKQAIEYIESLIRNYESYIIKDQGNPNYRYCGIWLSESDIIALKMGIEALKKK